MSVKVKNFLILNGTIKESTEEELNIVLGEKHLRPYVNRLYRNEITIEEVPEDIQAEVLEAVQNRTAAYGEYIAYLSDAEFRAKVEGAL